MTESCETGYIIGSLLIMIVYRQGTRIYFGAYKATKVKIMKGFPESGGSIDGWEDLS